MAVITITPVTLSPSTRSADLVGAGSTVTTADTFSITALGNTRNLIIYLEELNAGTATVTFNAGDNPPSALAADGNLAIALAQADLRAVMLEPGQFIQDSASTGPITGSVATNSVKIYALRISNEI